MKDLSQNTEYEFRICGKESNIDGDGVIVKKRKRKLLLILLY